MNCSSKLFPLDQIDWILMSFDTHTRTQTYDVCVYTLSMHVMTFHNGVARVMNEERHFFNLTLFSEIFLWRMFEIKNHFNYCLIFSVKTSSKMCPASVVCDAGQFDDSCLSTIRLTYTCVHNCQIHTNKLLI